MDNKPIENGKNEKIARKAGMYLSFIICAAALIIGFWSAISRAKRLSSNADSTASYSYSAVQSSAADAATARQAGAQKTDVKAENTSTENKTETTEKSTINPTAEFFAMPVGGSVIKEFSDTELKYSNTYKDWRIHTGVDIAAKSGTQVHCAGNGTVTEVRDDKLLGCTVVIDHGNGIKASYCGLAKALVKEGQTIEAGTTIGGIGEIPCESVDEAHLHFSVTVNGKAVDPIKAMDLEIQ